MEIEDDKFLSEEQFEANKKNIGEALKLLEETTYGGQLNSMLFISLSTTEKMYKASIQGELAKTSEGQVTIFGRGTNQSIETLIINLMQKHDGMYRIIHSALAKYIAYNIATNIKQRREN